MIRTEAEFKKILKRMPDHKIKKMSERMDAHHFPVLLLREYSRRFGTNDKAKVIANIAKQILKEKNERMKALKTIKIGMKNLSDYYVTQSGLDGISTKSIDAMHQKTKNITLQLRKAVIQVEDTSNKIILLEKLYKEL